MPAVSNDLLDFSRSVADAADFLNTVVQSNDELQVEDAVDDLLASYQRFTAKAADPATRYGFDELVSIKDPIERDQLGSEGLAAALLDLEVALVLGRAAEATGEIKLPVDSQGLVGAIESLDETLTALETKAPSVSGVTRFGFDEVATVGGHVITESIDRACAMASYEKQINVVYDVLLSESAALLKVSFKELADLDLSAIGRSVEAVLAPVKLSSAGRLALSVLESLKRAVEKLKDLLGADNVGLIQEKLGNELEDMRRGEGAAEQGLKHLYDCEGGRGKIEGWLLDSNAEISSIDRGTGELRDLEQRARQSFVLGQKISSVLHKLSAPVEWVLKRFGGTLPVDLLMAVAHLLVISVTLFRGMDYADTSPIFGRIEGVIEISRRNLGAAQG